MKKLLPLIFISTGIICLSACGQTGDLYLPKKDTKIASGSTMLISGSSAKQSAQNNISEIQKQPINTSSNSQN
ncbi:hypothetical protein fh0823_26370 [Francisella halioticida]|uniref:Lipoprotein n=1 Tax=Francisella halioticida TaxID=549298 RepID=A0ABM6LXY8_9GAMM|nr:lipoprotein [Francisella halioticida]ASG67335.1 hypothetical protein CDV26_02040 [Francisella halioticida]BCD92498.1 hypothetical protein fh0823_26370 [Francisella halioticida]